MTFGTGCQIPHALAVYSIGLPKHRFDQDSEGACYLGVLESDACAWCVPTSSACITYTNNIYSHQLLSLFLNAQQSRLRVVPLA